MGKHKQPKSIKKIWKLSGPMKLKFYCQMCQKQCRDEHGFKAHCSSVSHMNQMMLFSEHQEHYIEQHSNEFHSEFMQLLQLKKPKHVHVNSLYQEHILMPDHMHLNATKWATISDYISFIGKKGLVLVDEQQDGLYVTLKSSDTLYEKVVEKEKMLAKEAKLEALLLEKQISKASTSDVSKLSEMGTSKSTDGIPTLTDISGVENADVASSKTEDIKPVLIELKKSEKPITLQLQMKPKKHLKKLKLSTLMKHGS